MSTTRMLAVQITYPRIDHETGEVIPTSHTIMEERDANFHKLWLPLFMAALRKIGNPQVQTLVFLMEQMNRDNYICLTQQQIADKTKISRETVRKTMKELRELNFLRMSSKGVYQINPDIIYKGGKVNRGKLLAEYQGLEH